MTNPIPIPSIPMHPASLAQRARSTQASPSACSGSRSSASVTPPEACEDRSRRRSNAGGRSPERRLGGLGGWEERNDFFGAFGKFKKPSNVGRLKTLCFRGLDSKDMPRSVSCRIDLLIFSDHCPIVGVAYVPTTQR